MRGRQPQRDGRHQRLQVKLIVKETGTSTSAGLLAGKDLIENDHVVAIVGEQGNADQT